MSTEGIKDPSGTTAGKLVHLVFSKSSWGLIGAVWGYKYLNHALENTVIFKTIINALPALSPGRGIRTHHVVAVVLGLVLGVSTHEVACRVRLRLIQKLLAYHGWLYKPKARTTKIWGLALKLLVGPGPHSTFEFQKIMPKLPIPTVEESCNRYLEVVQPLLSEEDFHKTKELVKQFLQGDAQRLQTYLLEKDREKANWLADWWTESAYLSKRNSVAINVNFFMTSQYLENVACDPLSRAATNLYHAMRYQDMITHETLPPDLILDTIPVCMDGVRFLFSSCRIPGEETDRLEKYPQSTHAVCISKGIFYRIEMYEKDANGKLTPVTETELQNHLEFIVKDTQDVDRTKIPQVAALTTQNRTEWAKHRDMLRSNPVNEIILKDVESAIFVLVIGDETQIPKDISAMTKYALAGDGTNRWFDKSNTMEISQNNMGMSNMEHTGADATHFAVMWEHALQMEKYDENGHIIKCKNEIVRNIQPPKKLEWQLDSMRDIIDNALAQYRTRVDALDCIVYHTVYGKNYMKSKRVSPDGYLQMAIQLAYWRMHGEVTKTYEPASTRLFAFGRTDNINPVSEHSIRWTRMMDDEVSSSEEIISTMQQAIAFQSKARLEATAGYGCERHLLGLSLAATEMGIQQPELFTDKAFHLPMKLSTSQVPTTIGNRGVKCIPESMIGGFGPGCEDGYGLLYCSMGNDMFNFNITSWHTCPETDSRKFADAIHNALNDMKDLLDGKGKFLNRNGLHVKL